jgi:hypothetical protein
METTETKKSVDKEKEALRQRLHDKILGLSDEEFEKTVKNVKQKIDAITDEKDLGAIATNDGNWFARLAAVKRVKDKVFLSLLLVKEQNPEVKAVIQLRLHKFEKSED